MDWTFRKADGQRPVKYITGGFRKAMEHQNPAAVEQLVSRELGEKSPDIPFGELL